MESRIRNVMESVLGIDASKIDQSTAIATVEKWDSLWHMNLIVALEEEFSITFTQDEIVEMISFPLIKLIIEEKNNSVMTSEKAE